MRGRRVQTALPSDVLKRITALLTAMKRKERKLTRAALLRAVVARGLDELEALRRPRVRPH